MAAHGFICSQQGNRRLPKGRFAETAERDSRPSRIGSLKLLAHSYRIGVVEVGGTGVLARAIRDSDYWVFLTRSYPTNSRTHTRNTFVWASTSSASVCGDMSAML